MNVEYTGRNIAATAKLKAQAEAGLIRIDRVANRCTNAHVILSEDKYRKIAEVTVQCRNENFVATCESTDIEQALRDALYTVEQQAIRSKERFTTVRSRVTKPVQAPAA
jgi:putative sigma-54 modulation protein